MLPVTLQYPSGEQRTMRLKRVASELTKLANSSTIWGLGGLVIKVANAPDGPATVRKRTAPKPQRHTARPKKALRKPIDRVALLRAMKKPGFKAKAYADKIGAHEVTIYSLVRELKKTKARG